MAITNFGRCDRIAAIALSLSVLLGIIAFIPGGSLPTTVVKGYIVLVGVMVSFAAWLLGRLLEGNFRFPRTYLIVTLPILFGVLLISTFFSHSSSLSLLGEGLDQGTFVMLAIYMGMLFLASVLFTVRRSTLFILGFFGLYIILALFQVVRLIFPTATAFGILGSKVGTPAGIWSDFAFLSGAAVVGFTLILEFFKPSRLMKMASVLGIVLAAFFVILANVFIVWILVGAIELFVLVYQLVTTRLSEVKRFPLIAFIFSLVALMFIFANTLFGGMLATKLGASFISVNPSLSATMHVAGSSLRAHPIVGVGPNQFFHEWISYRPTVVNTSSLWNVPFSSGSSFLATVGFLSGILGVLAMLAFIAAFVYEGGKRVIFALPEANNSFFRFSIFIVALYFFAAVLFYSPGISIVICAFLFTGLFVASLVSTDQLPVRTIGFLKDHRVSFFTILLIVFLLMFSAAVLYAGTERFVAVAYYNQALRSAQKGDYALADTRLSRAIAIVDLPTFEETRVALATQVLQTTLSNATSTTSADSLKASVQQTISVGNAAARRAIELDPKNPTTYLTLGDFLRNILPLKADGTFEASRDAYNQAIALAPNYPLGYLSLAQLSFANGDSDAARTNVEKALSVKANYTEAYFLLSAIDQKAGDSAQAGNDLQQAVNVDGNNPEAYLQLGLFKFQNGDYSGAASALQATVSLDATYFNAWYFLAIADQHLGLSSDAIEILKALHTRLPDNQDVAKALDNANAGVITSVSSSTQIAPPAADTTTTATPDDTKTEKTTKSKAK